MFVANGANEGVEVVTLEQSEGNVFVRIDGLVGLSCLSEGRRLQLNRKWLRERGYQVELVDE